MAFSSVRISISVFGFLPAQGEPEECPLMDPSNGFFPMFPGLGNGGFGQQEAYARSYLPRLDGLLKTSPPIAVDILPLPCESDAHEL